MEISGAHCCAFASFCQEKQIPHNWVSPFQPTVICSHRAWSLSSTKLAARPAKPRNISYFRPACRPAGGCDYREIEVVAVILDGVRNNQQNAWLASASSNGARTNYAIAGMV